MSIFLNVLGLIVTGVITIFCAYVAVNLFICSVQTLFRRSEKQELLSYHVNGFKGWFFGQGVEDRQGILTESGMMWDENGDIVPHHKISRTAIDS